MLHQLEYKKEEVEMSYEIDMLSKINMMLITRHNGIFTNEKVLSWDWVIKKLDEIITVYENLYWNE